jgi:hypothetical protein
VRRFRTEATSCRISRTTSRGQITIGASRPLVFRELIVCRGSSIARVSRVRGLAEPLREIRKGGGGAFPRRRLGE